MGVEQVGQPDAIVHIGTAKTGTTTLQQSLQDSASVLAEHRIAYLPSDGMINARELAAASVGPDGFDDHLDALGHVSPEDRARYRSEVSGRFERQVAQASASSASTVVISSEHLHSRLVTAEMVDRFAALVTPHVSTTRIVCYLRPQLDLVVSFHSTHLRNGGSNTFAETLEHMLRLDSAYVNYEMFLAPWAGAFGEESIEVRIFDRAAFCGGSVVSDFAARLGLPAGSLEEPSSDANQSISHIGQVLLGELHRAAGSGRLNTERAAEIRQAVAAAFIGKGQTLGPTEAAAAQSRFDESNERVRARFRPDLDRLFPHAEAAAAAVDGMLTADQESAIRAAFDLTAPPVRRSRLQQATRRFSR